MEVSRRRVCLFFYQSNQQIPRLMILLFSIMADSLLYINMPIKTILFILIKLSHLHFHKRCRKPSSPLFCLFSDAQPWAIMDDSYFLTSCRKCSIPNKCVGSTEEWVKNLSKKYPCLGLQDHHLLAVLLDSISEEGSSVLLQTGVSGCHKSKMSFTTTITVADAVAVVNAVSTV